MRVAVFTDNDFDKVNGVTTTLNALVVHAPADVSVRIYTAAALGDRRPALLGIAIRAAADSVLSRHADVSASLARILAADRS